jgi:hypothetical protein
MAQPITVLGKNVILPHLELMFQDKEEAESAKK